MLLSTHILKRATVWTVALVAALLVCAPLSAPAAQEDESGEEEAEEPDYLELAAMLFGDGHLGRAERALSRIDPKEASEEDEDFDLERYHTLSGLVALEQRDYGPATDHLDQALESGADPKPVLHVYLTQAHYGAQSWKETVEAAHAALEAGNEQPELYLMSAHALRELDRPERAWTQLERGEARHADHSEFQRQKIYLLIELGLYQRAAELGESYLAKSRRDVDDHLALGQAFLRAGAAKRAKAVLETAQLRYPEELEVTVHLAHAYMETGELRSAAELLQRAAVKEAKYRRESAELFRRAGAFERALYMNAQVRDQKKKFQQRVAILLDQKKFEEIAALQARLSRLGLLEDDQMLYTLAYARFQTRDYEGAERLLEQISDAKVFEDAVELRRTVQMCREEPLGC